MKNEKQCLERLEDIVSGLEKNLAEVTPLQKEGKEDVPRDLQIKIAVGMGMLCVFAYVLDEEDSLRPFLRKLRIQAIVDAMNQMNIS